MRHLRTASLIPSAFTLLNLFCGFSSVLATLRGNFHLAAWLVIVCALIDAVDGRLARWTGSESSLGLQLDSMCDMVSFGVAPALLINEAVLEPFPMQLSVPIAFSYAAAGAYRLARFNAMNADRAEHHYCGLTIPIAAMTTSSFWFFQRASGGALPGWSWILLCVSLPVLMVSTIPYYWPRVGFRRGWRLSLQSVGVFAGAAVMLVFPERSMFPLFATFILAGLLNKTVSAMRGEDAFWRRLRTAERRDP